MSTTAPVNLNSELSKEAPLAEEEKSSLFVEILEALDEEEKKKDEEHEVDELPLEVQTPLPKPMDVFSSSPPVSAIKPVTITIIAETKFAVAKNLAGSHIILQTKEFAEVEIVLERFSTAPSCYHIEIRGNAALQKLILANKVQIEAALQKALPSHECSLLPPVYPTEKRKWPVRKKGIEKTNLFRYGAKEGEIKGHAAG